MAVPLQSQAAQNHRPVSAVRPADTAKPCWVVVVENLAELEQYLPAWEDLAAAAVEPNVFYEAWMLLPALRAYGAGTLLTIVLIFIQRPHLAGGQPMLCGLFPLERQRRFPGSLARVLRLWTYVHCYLAVPLVRAGFGRECLAAFFAWLAADPRGAALLECELITGDGPFYHLLLEHLEEQRRSVLVTSCYTRALLRSCCGDYDPQATLSGERRKKLRRAEERLAEAGPVRYAELTSDGDVEVWLANFLRLEASGWKSEVGTALACQEADRQFFLEVVRAAFRRQRLRMLALYVGDRPVAQLCDLLSREGGFAFKVGFDAAVARCSPGVLLEVESARRLANRPELCWLDSCTVAGDTLIKHLWTDRRIIQTVLVETGRAPGPLLLATLPLLRWWRRRLEDVIRWVRGPVTAPTEDNA